MTAAVTTRVDPAELDPEAVARLWLAVTEAGGAIGLAPPVTLDDVRPLVASLLTAATDRPEVELLAARDGAELIGLVALQQPDDRRTGHRATLQRLQVHPRRQGSGLGRRLVAAAHARARERGAELVLVAVRSGQGLEAFYERLGYQEVGRIRDGLRFEDGSYRDEVLLAVDLRG